MQTENRWTKKSSASSASRPQQNVNPRSQPSSSNNQNNNINNNNKQIQNSSSKDAYSPGTFEVGKYKTKLCRHWKTGYCLFGASCVFAHGVDDLCEPNQLMSQMNNLVLVPVNIPAYPMGYGNEAGVGGPNNNNLSSNGMNNQLPNSNNSLFIGNGGSFSGTGSQMQVPIPMSIPLMGYSVSNNSTNNSNFNGNSSTSNLNNGGFAQQYSSTASSSNPRSNFMNIVEVPFGSNTSNNMSYYQQFHYPPNYSKYNAPINQGETGFGSDQKAAKDNGSITETVDNNPQDQHRQPTEVTAE